MTPAAVLSILVKTEGATAAAGQLKNVDDTAKRSSDSMDKASESAKKHSSILGSVAKTGALAAGAAGIGGLAFALKTGIGEWKDSTKVAAQTQAVLKSTGGVANVTAGHISDLAGKLMKKSGVDDEAIQSGENLIATFTNIRNEAGKGNKIFDETTKAALDMATALGTDPKNAAMQLGKALNDPTKGMGRLTRSGVTFTEAQKNMVDKLQASGDMLGAQKIILGEVNKEFGGSAEAAGKTLPGQLNVLKETFNNLAGDLVGKLVPVLQSTIQWLRDHWGEISAAFNTFWQSAQPILKNLWDLLKSVAQVVIDNWPLIKPIVETMGKDIQNVAKVIGDAIKVITDILHGDWSKAWQDAKQLVFDWFTTIKDHVTGIAGELKTILLAVGPAILDGLKAGLSGLAALGSWILDQLVAGLKASPQALLDLAGWLKDRLWDGLKAIPGAIHDVGGWVVRTIVAGLKLEVAGLLAIGGWLKDRVLDGLKTVIDAVKGVGGWVIRQIVAGARLEVEGLLAIGGWLKNRILDGLNAVIDAVKDLGGWVIRRVVEGIRLEVAGLVAIGGWLKNRLLDGLTSVKDGITGLGGSIIGWIVDGLKAGAIKVQSFLNDIIDIIRMLPGIDEKNLPHINVIKKAEGGAYGSGTIPAGLARGGAYARTGGKVSGPITLMGEEAPRHPEYVIPTNPAYKDRAAALWAQAGKAIGLAGGGTFMSTAYGPPWGGIQGTGVTATGVDLRGNPSIYGIAIDPSVLKLNATYNVQPNPFNTSAGFKAFDTGGAIKGNRIDFYDWRGRDYQNAWGMRNVQVSGGGGGIGGLISGAVGAVGGVLGSLLSKGAGFIIDQLPDTGGLPDWLKGTGSYILDKVKDWVRDKVSGLTGGLLGGGGGVSGPKGVGTFNGIPMANWVIDSLKYAQSKGVAVRPTSGYRPGFDPHTASGRSEHQGTQYPHGAVDFGGYHDAAALAMKMAVVNATRDFKWPLLAPAGFIDDGHASGTGHYKGGIYGRYVGAFANGGVVPRTGLAMVHGGETITPAGGASVVVEHHYHGPVVQDKDFIQYLRNLDRSYSRQNGRPAFGG